MDLVAQLTVTSGPDRGKSIRLAEELVHIGRGQQNHVVISDPALSDHQASIVYRNGRYAIYAPWPDTVNIDGNALPAERWVWLPLQATIRLGPATEVMFEATEDTDTPATRETIVLPVVKPIPMAAAPLRPSPPLDARGDAKPATGNGVSGALTGRSSVANFAASTTDGGSAPASPGSVPATGSSTGSSVVARGRRGKKGERKAAAPGSVARFITDRAGETLVTLGEDGQLPELHLDAAADTSEKVRVRPGSSGGKPAVLYGALAASFLLSLSMLLVEPSGPRSSSVDRSSARQQIETYFGGAGGELQPYQRLLRQARIEYAQGDLVAERNLYRQVLRMLNSADIIDRRNLNGLTGRQTGRGRGSDDELRALLETLISR